MDAAYWELVLTDIRDAADLLRPTFDELAGRDGFVSVEVAPDRAYDSEATITQVRWLHDQAARPNVFVKIPATAEGVPAIEESIAAGISVNVTLIFSLVRYGEVIEAYVRGVERLLEAEGDPASVASVASFFVSRVDTEADKRLPDGHPLRGRVAVANAKLAYELFRERFSGERWAVLESQGARVQRPLWASTSTKNPDYSDTLYVDELVGRDTVNTLAQPSMDALRDHGDPQPDTITHDLDGADEVMVELGAAGVDYDDLTATIEQQGVDSFEKSYVDCLRSLEQRASELAA
jgi:transaldolase